MGQATRRKQNDREYGKKSNVIQMPSRKEKEEDHPPLRKWYAEQREQAKEAARNLIDRAALQWPKAKYNQPSEPAATPEEIAENKRFYESQRAQVN